MSYLNIPTEVLRNSIKEVELAERRADKQERLHRLLLKGPMFHISHESHAKQQN